MLACKLLIKTRAIKNYMFDNKSKKEGGIKDAETIIGQSVKVKGNFQGQGNIIIEGSVEGNVITSNFLFIGSKAKINANVEAKDANIGGEVNGNIKTQGYLEIKSSAKISGDIEATEISIEKGAVLNGNCNMSNIKKDQKE